MKKIILASCLVGFFAGMIHYGPEAEAQSVYVTHTVDLPNGAIIGGVMNVCHQTGIIDTARFREIVFDITYNDSGGAPHTTDLNMTCHSSNNPAMAWATSAIVQGVNVTCVAPWCSANTMPLIFRHTPILAAGVDHWTYILDRTPQRYAICEFCGVGSVVADTMSVNATGVTP